MQEKCTTSCKFSKAIIPYGTRLCTVCGHEEIPKYSHFQTKCHVAIKKHFGRTASSIRMEPNCIKLNTKILMDSDFQFFYNLDGSYKNIEVKRSGLGVLIILKF